MTASLNVYVFLCTLALNTVSDNANLSSLYHYWDLSSSTMGASAIPLVIVTLFWVAIGGVLPFFVRKGPNRGVTQSCLILTSVVCWLFWLYCYMAQMNPLIGPDLKKNILLLMDRQWGHFKPE